MKTILIVLFTVGFTLGQNLKYVSATAGSAATVITIDLGIDTDEAIPSFMPGGDEFRLVAIQFEGTWTTATATVSASSAAAGDYDDVYDVDGTAFTINIASDRYIWIDPRKFAGLRFIKLTFTEQGQAGTYVLVKRQY